MGETRPELACVSAQASSCHGHLLTSDLEDSGTTSLWGTEGASALSWVHFGPEFRATALLTAPAARA